MAEPRIQYAKTEDGVSIAFSTLGTGMPLVQMPMIPLGQLEGFPEVLALQRPHRGMLVRYDGRGSGLSERNVTDFSLDARLLDLAAVVDQLGLERFALLGGLHHGPVAITYAARNQERLSHLILWCSWARASDFYASEEAQTLASLRDKDWETYIQAMAHAFSGWSGGEETRGMAALMRESITREALQASAVAAAQFDVTALLPQVRSPTLVLHARGLRLVDVQLARGLASGIAGARLAVVPGQSVIPVGDEAEAMLEAIDEFLGEGEEAEVKAELPEGMAVILFADIVESTALTEQLGDVAFREKARELDASLRTIIRECGGTPVEGKVLGDGVLAVFTSARQAIECALRCGAAGDSVGLKLHLGIHAGDVIREGNNVYGGAVNIAARIAAESGSGEVLVSDTVRGLARTSAGVSFDDCGEHQLKGVGEPQRLFAVRGGGG